MATDAITPRRRRWTGRLILSLISVIGLLGLAVAYLLLTAQAAEAITRFVLSRYVGLHHISIGRVDGNLLEGFIAREVRIPDLIKRHPGVSLDIAQAQITALASWKARGPAFIARGLRLSPSPLAEEMTADRAEGSVVGGVVFHDLHLRDVHRLTPGATLGIQKLDTAWPIGWRQVRTIQNGRLWLTQLDPVVFFGHRQNEQIEARVFSKTLDVEEVRGATIKLQRLLIGMRGAVHDLNLTVNGTENDWSLNGTFQIERLSRKGVAIANNAGRMRLRIQTGPWRVKGKILCWGGALTSKRMVIHVQPSTFLFTGNPLSLTFDLKGSSTIGTTRIYLALKGTKEAPQLMLTSDPPVAQEALLAMLVTGKSWRVARESLAQGEISSELATDFIDYAFFGGAGNRMARWFGITDFAITQNLEHNTVGAQTTFADRTTFGMEVESRTRASGNQTARPSASKPPLPYRVGAAYQLTERISVQLEGERGMLEQNLAPQTDSSVIAEPAPKTDSTILLKVKKRF